MTERVSNSMMSRNILSTTQQTLTKIAKLQQELASGKRVTRVSDDPGAATVAMRGRVTSFQSGKYLDNISKTQAFLDITDSTMGEMTSILTEARSLAVQGANGTQDAASRAALAQSVDAQLHRLVELANTVHDGRFLFSGTDTQVEPFVLSEDGSTVDYQGNLDTFSVQIGPHATMEVNQNGHQIFKQQADAFAALIQLRDALNNNDPNTANALLTDIDAAHNIVNNYHGALGGKAQRLESTRNQLEATRISIDEQVSLAEDADFAATIADLLLAQTALEAGLQAGAKVLQPSLLNYL